MRELVKGKSRWEVQRFDRSYTALWLELLKIICNKASRFSTTDAFIKDCRYDKKSSLYLLSDDEVANRIRWGRNIFNNTYLLPLTTISFFAQAEKKAQYILLALSKAEADRVYNEYKPYDTEVSKWGNVFLNEGINTMWNLVTGQGAETNYSNANARVGVGNSTTTASATDTGLLGTSTAFKAMDTGFPTTGTNQQAVFRGTFLDAEAAFSWDEQTVDNGATPNKNLNRKITALGIKPTTETWILTGTLTLS